MKQHIYPDQIWTGLCKSLWWMYLTQIWTLSTMLLNPIWSCYMFGQFQTLYVSFSLCFVCRFVLESMPAVWVICHCLTGSWTLYNRWEDFFFVLFCFVQFWLSLPSFAVWAFTPTHFQRILLFTWAQMRVNMIWNMQNMFTNDCEACCRKSGFCRNGWP